MSSDSDLYKLDKLEIISPCQAVRTSLQCDDLISFCHLCQKNVYNLSKMSSKDAEKLLKEKDGQLCVRIYKRSDGTIVSDNCPKVLKPIRNGLRRIASIAAATVAMMSTFTAVYGQNNDQPGSSCKKDPAATNSKSFRTFPRQLQIIDGGIKTTQFDKAPPEPMFELPGAPGPALEQLQSTNSKSSSNNPPTTGDTTNSSKSSESKEIKTKVDRP